MNRHSVRSARYLMIALLLAGTMSFGGGDRPDASRPLVLVVHGRGMLGRDTASLRRDWTRALETGIRHLGDTASTAAVELRLVWYADALDPSSPAICERTDGSVGAGEEEIGGLRLLLEAFSEAIGPLSRGGAGLGAPARGLVGDFLYFADESRRCAAAGRLDEALRDADPRRPVVVVAHSFGSIVAYDYLRSRDGTERRIERFITVGSPLGFRGVRDILLVDSVVAIPRGVGRWINVVDPRDPLSSRFGGDGQGGPEDISVVGKPAAVPHDVAAYLSDPATARAILGR